MMEKDRRPSPFSPATAAEGPEVAAIHAGGCGSCTGFGVTMRLGNENRSDSYSKYSSRHMPTTILMASAQSERDCSRSTWNAACSIGVERPVPHSTRPLDRMSTEATFSAIRCGGVNPNGVRVTPKPNRICSVICDSAPNSVSGAGQCDLPSRKWCSTAQTVLKPRLSPSLICSIASRYARCSASRWPYGCGLSHGLGASIS
jgi:hypothetical protein